MNRLGPKYCGPSGSLPTSERLVNKVSEEYFYLIPFEFHIKQNMWINPVLINNYLSFFVLEGVGGGGGGGG